MQQVSPAIRAIYAVTGAVASEARWTDTFSSVAAQVLWLLPHNLGCAALLQQWPDRPARQNKGASALEGGESAEPAEMSWAQVQGQRLRQTRLWWTDRETLGHLLAMILASGALRHLLHWVFAKEAHVYPDLQAYAARHGCLVDPPSGNDHPVAACLANGAYVTERLREGSSLLRPGQKLLIHESHALELMHARLPWDGPAKNPVATLRAALLPGLAQVWYRALYKFTVVWPWPLLALLDVQGTPEAMEIAQALLSAEPCCLDSGFSVPLRTYLQRRYGMDVAVLAPVIANLTDALLRVLLTQWREDMEVSVVDCECRHARHRRGEHGGRPPHFSTSAAQCYLRECAILHAQVTGTPQQHQWASAVHETQRFLEDQGRGKESRKRKSGPVANPYFAFRADCERRHRTARSRGLHNPLQLPADAEDAEPRTIQWEHAVAAQWKGLPSLERHRWFLEASQQKEKAQTQLALRAHVPVATVVVAACGSSSNVETQAMNMAKKSRVCRGLALQ